MPVDRIYVLGPEGTFSDVAARRFRDYLRRAGEGSRLGEGEGVEITYTRSIAEALEVTARRPHARAVAPIENSESGIVTLTLDHLARLDLFIDWELSVRIRYRIVSDVPLPEVTRLFVHPVALEQCLSFVTAHLPQAETALTRSNVDSGVVWSKAAPSERSAAIVPLDHRTLRAAFVEVPNVANDTTNTTRFVVARARRGTVGDFSRAKTSLLITPDADRPGLLAEILAVFKKQDINLCRIESRPAKTRNWAYVFHMDIANNARAGDAVRELEQGRVGVQILGTFDELPEESLERRG